MARCKAVAVHAVPGGQVGAAALAGKDMAFVAQPDEGRLVQVATLALVDRRLVRLQAEGVQGGKDRRAEPGHLARRIEVLDAHQPFAARLARQQPAAERGDQRAEVQVAGGRGGESSAVGHGVQV